MTTNTKATLAGSIESSFHCNSQKVIRYKGKWGDIIEGQYHQYERETAKITDAAIKGKWRDVDSYHVKVSN